MPLIGNDVVDLTSPANVQKSTDLRFLKKILTDTEIGQVRCASQPEASLWSFWACKEAAYKVMKKQTGDAAFMPRRWSVCFRPPALSADAGGPLTAGMPTENRNALLMMAGHVAVPGIEEIPFFLFPSASYVHCLAADRSAFLDKAVWRVVALPDDCKEEEMDPSAFVRSGLTASLSTVLHADEARIKIFRAPRGRGELEPPAVYLDGIKTPIDISMSHDGRFAAYAFLT